MHCRSKGAYEIEYEVASEGGEKERVIGGVGWEICAMEVEDSENTPDKMKNSYEYKPVEKKVRFEKMPKEKNQKEKKQVSKDTKVFGKIQTRNRFEVLEKDEVKYEEQVQKQKEQDGDVENPKKYEKKAYRKKPEWKELNVLETNERPAKSKITIDSGAEESVWPISQVYSECLVETEASKNDVGFIAANGSRMKNYGAIQVEFKNQGKPMSMNFHATTVKKPLAAVCRITDRGNKVCFGPDPEDNFIMTISTGEKIPIKRERGTYVLETELKSNNSVFPRRE
jgi:hypothetical protein